MNPMENRSGITGHQNGKGGEMPPGPYARRSSLIRIAQIRNRIHLRTAGT